MLKFKLQTRQNQATFDRLLNRAVSICHNCGYEKDHECEICNGNSYATDYLP
ncbi:hypothetical protein [Dyadobacter jejuensis]|uniref:hypothetical protein n=1 Tax=Dyadobacter jejuensis TaxID=1082580 RepID=UPI001304A191|nr:hypothetical protein [Dyadobacter jejuensis]